MFCHSPVPAIEFHSTSVATWQCRCEHHSALAAPSVRCWCLPACLMSNIFIHTSGLVSIRLYYCHIMPLVELPYYDSPAQMLPRQSHPLPFPHHPHDAVPPAGGQQPVEEHHCRGEASNAVACTGTAGIHGTADGLPDHGGV